MTKFDEVSSDILNFIINKKYDDEEKERIRINILYNLSILTSDEESYNRGIDTLQKNYTKKTLRLKMEQ